MNQQWEHQRSGDRWSRGDGEGERARREGRSEQGSHYGPRFQGFREEDVRRERSFAEGPYGDAPRGSYEEAWEEQGRGGRGSGSQEGRWSAGGARPYGEPRYGDRGGPSMQYGDRMREEGGWGFDERERPGSGYGSGYEGAGYQGGGYEDRGHQGGYGGRGSASRGGRATSGGQPWGTSLGSSRNVGRGSFGSHQGMGLGVRGPGFGSASEGPYSGTTYGGEGYGGEGSGREHGGFAGKGPKGYRRSDERIQEEICERMSEHPGIDPSDCEVKVRNGEVTLSGTVGDRRMKRLAEDCCEDVPGVLDVTNQIKVSRGSQGEEGGESQLRPRERAGSQATQRAR